MIELMREPIKKMLTGRLAKVAFSTSGCLKSHHVIVAVKYEFQVVYVRFVVLTGHTTSRTLLKGIDWMC